MKIKSLLTRPASLEMVISGFIDIYPRSGVFALEPVPQNPWHNQFNRNLSFSHEARAQVGSLPQRRTSSTICPHPSKGCLEQETFGASTTELRFVEVFVF
jgi:hypothetical protein